MDIKEQYDRWVARATECDADELAALATDESALTDAFYRELAFGTGGLRGIIGAGPNRMNVYTVGKATQGLADYLNANFEAPSVAIARDSRNMGETFVQVAAGVLAANGVKAFLYPRIEPTPALSFAVRDLGCLAGICMTASHNPAAYNGYKVYGADGCQITTQAANDISEAIAGVDVFDDVRRMSFDDGVDAGLISWIEEGTLDRFIEAVLAQGVEANSGAAVSTNSTRGDLSVVYTPLHGTGLECVTRVLEAIGVQDVIIEPEQAIPDGNFPTCPYPNPEIREALERGLELCKKKHPDLLLATDPDADRVGIAVADNNGEYQLLTGNEVGILLLDYVAGARSKTQAAKSSVDAKELDGEKPLVAVTTIVSSAMADVLARTHGFELRRTLTGFKYIGEQIGLLEAVGQEGRYLLGFEESYGYLSGTHVRDKDAVNASMLICQMARAYKAQGKTLLDAMHELYERYGYYKNGLTTIEYPGADGATKMKSIMDGLRAAAPTEIAGLEVKSVIDYANGTDMPIIGNAGDARDVGGTEDSREDSRQDCGKDCRQDYGQKLPPADVVEFRLASDAKLIVRPSGTEPKIKAYTFVSAATDADACQLLDALNASAKELLS